MASTVTRSTRRAESRPQGSAMAMGARPAILHHAANGGGGGHTKRPIDEDEFESVMPTKRQRISVEIISKNPLVTSSNEAFTKVPPPPPPPQSLAKTKTKAKSTVAKTGDAPTTKGDNKQPPAVPPKQDQQQQQQQQTLTKHQAKVINGIKHELALLQPNPANVNSKDQGRKLRSQEATRFKSELAAYFPDYDEVIGNEEKEQHLLNVDTPIVVLDSSKQRVPGSQSAIQPPHYNQQQKQQPPNSADSFPVRGYGDVLYTDVCDSQRINFSFLERESTNKTLDDPLPDKLYQQVHKRAERLERSIRNTEKGRAQHEKDRIIHLLDGLQGHDWLRVMGVSGVTETKKKGFQPARQHFIKGCQGILEKFRNWSLEEKRRKLEKEKALVEQADEDEEDEDGEDEDGGDEAEEAEEEEEEDDDDDDDEAEEEDEAEDDEDAEEDDDDSTAATSETSSPAKQLREETLARSQIPAKPKTRIRIRTRPPTIPPAPPKEFKSFFEKSYERETALHSNRRAGRKVLAWGHPIMELPESDFMLPEEYRDEETLRVRARKKRRDKRSSRG